MEVKVEHTNGAPIAAAVTEGEQSLQGMNQSFAKCLSLVCPPIQYPPHCRFNPVQQDAADTTEIEARLEELFLHAKQIELLFLANKSQVVGDSDNTEEYAPVQLGRSDLETEIVHLEAELNEKNELIEKYSDVVRGWEGKFKRLEGRLNPDKE
ncbi:TPA: hypothetical protein N0F65_003955 [Lagenidium giganteum]|uniref:Mediator of RNA polymerase II transcription subunit 21 n=1 Tax=Lagenidium giganteum TaxID=4803 RepID=A0AAV2YSG9_9STRA|nr:TPA: hypothetical protein N0F65_003955 [Lagenidium giganteum]